MHKEAFIGAVRQVAKKLAPGTAVHRALGGGGAGAGAGGLVGAGVGAATSGTQAYRQAREQGAGTREALLSSVGGTARGLARGAVLGAGVGAAGGAAAGALGKGRLLANLSKGEGALGSAARFGQRQVHGLTGWTPQAGLQSIRGGSYGARKALRSAEAGRLSPKSPKAALKARADVVKAREALKASEDAERMGLTSLPGYVRALAKNPKEAIRTGVREQWAGTGPLGKALVAGLPAATIGGELVSSGEPGGPGRLERAAGRLGDLAFMAGPLPITAQLVAAPAIGAAGSGTAKLLSRRKREKPKNTPAPPTLEPAGGETQPGEAYITDRALGMGGGGV